MKLLAYVSDERFAAISGATIELASDAAVHVLTSTPSGAVYGDVAPARYNVTIGAPGFGTKRTELTVGNGPPRQFRLLSERILGYVWPKWSRAGDSAVLRVHSPEPYRLSLVRCGRETGPETLLGWFDEHGPRATVQVLPDGDFTQTGVHWRDSGSIVAPDETGLYYFLAEGESGAFFSFPWVVAPRTPTCDLAVLASTNTWSAYNNFGGRSNYVNASRLPDYPTVVAHQDLLRYREGTPAEHSFPDEDYLPISFERPEPLNQILRGEQPTHPIRGRQPCHLAAAEWRLYSWLERERFRYDLYAEAQLHDGTLDLDRYRALVIHTHPEYWSRQMYSAVKAWVFERGGRLVYLGGNGLECEVEFLNDSTLHFRTQDEDPGGPFENRMHRSFEPTAAVLGVMFTNSGAMTAAPYRVVDESHWAFASTGLCRGDIFGAASLHERVPGGASGHETDKRTRSSPPGTRLLAKGTNVDDGGAEMIHFETPNGGDVFSVGSITWPASILVDNGVSRITRNVLDHFLAARPGVR
ncbi:MAG: carboxypeptidase regulatory-like domain-containing protein [Chloroflexi bacterium]|nr:carboxypeptidase regulatory-like domain-containing protein [Chloroflexota bacterium]